MKKLLFLLPFLLNCGPSKAAFSLSGCYKSTLIVQKDTDHSENTVENHTFCVSDSTWDSYHGTLSGEQMNIEEVRVVQVDEHWRTEQHFAGWAKSDWADIVDEVVIYHDGVVHDSYHLLFEYENVVKNETN